MGPYEQVLSALLELGTPSLDRTGVGTRRLFGLNLTYDMDFGFPLLTTKKVPFGAVKAELLGFLGAYDSAAQFRNQGTKIWDANANENKAWLNNPFRRGEDDLGPIYGRQWREWQDTRLVPATEDNIVAMYKHGYRYRGTTADGTKVYDRSIDQIGQVIDTIKKDPYSRRMVVSAWNVGDIDRVALPPCHAFMQFSADPLSQRLHLLMYQRSADWFLGVPFNIASYALLLSMVAHVTGYTPGSLMLTFGDVHLYENHKAQAQEQISRDPFPFPTLHLDPSIRDIDCFTMESIKLQNYESHPEIKAPMAV